MAYKTTRQMCLIKGEETYIFRYNAGCEPEAVVAMGDLAANPNLDFDWFDAAVLCYQMGRRIGSEISDLVK